MTHTIRLPRENSLNRLSKKIRKTVRDLLNEIAVFEYVLWWMARAMMLYVVLFCAKSEKVMCFINMLALYTVSFIRFVAPEKSFSALVMYAALRLLERRKNRKRTKDLSRQPERTLDRTAQDL